MGENEKPIRMGVMGCAEIARKMCRAVALAPNATLFAIASRSLHKAQQFALINKLSPTVKLYGSYAELLDDPLVDAVYMPLPTTLHLQWALMAAQKGKHLLLEKPTAIHVNVLDQILEACQSNRVQFMDASMWYHHPRTAQIKQFISNPRLFGTVKFIHSCSSFHGTGEFLEDNIRVKPELDALGALGDTGWYCIGAILWAMNQKLPTTVTALPPTKRNSSGVILSCAASLHWEEEQVVATFYCSFITHESMDLVIVGSMGTLHVDDFIIPYDQKCASFNFTTAAAFVDLHIGWNVKPEEVQVSTELPQEALMIQELCRLVKAIKDVGLEPDTKWAKTSRTTQLVLDGVKHSIDKGFKPVTMMPN